MTTKPGLFISPRVLLRRAVELVLLYAALAAVVWGTLWLATCAVEAVGG